MLTRSLALLTVLASTVFACEAEPPADADGADIVSRKVNDHWFYSGAIPPLENPSIVASMKGHTVRVTGLVPAATNLAGLPHVKTKPVENGKMLVDVVYPIATAGPGKSNSRPGTYAFYQAKPYRPNGPAFTHEEGWHDVPWGGFPFIAYNDGIAFHGPITAKDNEAPGDLDVWYLRRGKVSGGCNRMMGEHVVELAHIIGIDMRRIYAENTAIKPTTSAKVVVIDDYDRYDGKWVDVDYPTDAGATRPAAVHGADSVVMFGSWILSEMPNGEDLPGDMKWQGGVNGAWYDFQGHAQRGVVCSMPKSALGSLRDVAARSGGSLPADFCQRKVTCDERLGRLCAPGEILP